MTDNQRVSKEKLRLWLINNIAVWDDGGDDPGSRAALVTEANIATLRTILMRLDEGLFDD